MPPMKLGFIKNATQRIAAHRWIPSQHLEAVIRYGAPSKRAKAIKKVVEEAPQLARHKQTHQLLLTVSDVTDKITRCEILYAFRGKVADLARDRFGNVVLQKLIEGLPATQLKEIARDMIVHEEAADMARHQFGNHVMQKLARINTDAREAIEGALESEMAALAVHPVAQHMVAVLVEVGSPATIAAVSSDSTVLQSLLALKESAVLTALVKSPRVSDDVQERARAVLFEGLEQLVATGRQHFALAAAVETLPESDVAAWMKALAPHAAAMGSAQGMAEVLATAVRKVGRGGGAALVTPVLRSFKSIVEAAEHPYGSLVVRASLTSGCPGIAEKGQAHVLESAEALASSPAGAVVVTRLLELGIDEQTIAIADTLMPNATTLATHRSACHVLQAVMVHAPEAQRQAMAAAVLKEIATLSMDECGTFVVQKALSTAEASVVADACTALRPTLVDTAQDPKGCHTVAVALLVSKSHDLPEAKVLMDGLKPHVTMLAVKPWSGRIVLEAMFKVGSAQLKAAIQDVIFMKCEYFLAGGEGAALPVAKGGAGQRRSRSSGGDAPASEHRKPRAETNSA